MNNMINELRLWAGLPWDFIEEILKDVPKEDHFDYLCDILDTYPEFDKKEWVIRKERDRNLRDEKEVKMSF